MVIGRGSIACHLAGYTLTHTAEYCSLMCLLRQLATQLDQTSVMESTRIAVRRFVFIDNAGEVWAIPASEQDDYASFRFAASLVFAILASIFTVRDLLHYNNYN